MKTKKILFALLLFALFSYSAHSKIWVTKSSGYWNNGFTWIGNVAPPYSSPDTFIIQHPVVAGVDVLLNDSAFLQIDTTGGLCGHQNITVETGATILKFGILEFDTLYIPGGKVICLGPGEVIITQYAIVNNGGLLTVNGCQVSIGPWFNCHVPEFAFAATGIIEEENKSSFNLFPNPNNGNFNLSYHSSTSKIELQITDLIGRTVYKQFLRGEGIESIDVSDFGNGVYYWLIISDNDIPAKGNIVVVK